MNFEYSEKSRQLLDKLGAFMDEHIYPNEQAYAKAAGCRRKQVCACTTDG